MKTAIEMFSNLLLRETNCTPSYIIKNRCIRIHFLILFARYFLLLIDLIYHRNRKILDLFC